MIIENTIVIKGGAYNEIKKALRQWIELYSEDLQDNLIFQLFKNGRGNHIIQADKSLDNERFFYLINYLNYPEEIEYKIDIQGFTIGKEENQFKNKYISVYISSTDKEYDNVLVTTAENENFKVDFGGKIIEIKEKRVFNYPSDLIFENPETIKSIQRKIIKKEEKINENTLDKRFKILSIIVFCLMLIGIIAIQIDPRFFRMFSLFSGLGLGIYFMFDYKMLQSDRHYFYSLGIAIVYLLFTVFCHREFNNGVLEYGFALQPLALLLIQKPTRLIYKAVLNREPVVDHRPPTFWDSIYLIILYFGLGVLPFILLDSLIR